MFNEFYTPIDAFQTAVNGYVSGLKDAFHNARDKTDNSFNRTFYQSPIPLLVSADHRQKSEMDESYKFDLDLFKRCYRSGEKAGTLLAKIIP